MAEIQTQNLDDFKPDLLLDRLVIGNSNRAAFTAVWALSQNPLPASGPVVVFGGQGLGKSHLAIGAALEMKRIRPHLKVLYFPTEVFVSFIRSSQAAQKVAKFCHFCRTADVIMFDDYGQIERWTETDLPRHFSRLSINAVPCLSRLC